MVFLGHISRYHRNSSRIWAQFGPIWLDLTGCLGEVTNKIGGAIFSSKLKRKLFLKFHHIRLDEYCPKLYLNFKIGRVQRKLGPHSVLLGVKARREMDSSFLGRGPSGAASAGDRFLSYGSAKICPIIEKNISDESS